MASNAIVNRQVNIYINSGEAQKALDALIAKEKILKDEIAKTTDPKKLAALNKELAKLSEPIDRATKKVKGELTPSFRELEAATRRWLAEFKKTGDPDALANFKKFNVELQKQKSLINDLNDSQSGLTKGGIFQASFWANLAAGGIAAAGSALQSFLGDSIAEFQEAELATMSLANALENFGAIEAMPKLTKQADDLAKKFKFLDNDDITKAQDKLVTFGKLTTTEIQKLIPVIVDYAAKTGKNVPEAADDFIKALEGQAKGIKTFGVEVKDTNGIAKNFNILTTEMAQKVRGAADAFGESSQGKIKSFRQTINNLEEDFGRFISKIFETKKTADALFDEANKESKKLDDSLGPLLATYDELKSKTTLNKDEQVLLQGVIQKIVEIVPQAATEFDKYGNALDINKQKVIDFRKENSKFLQTREKDAIDELTEKASKQVGVIKQFVDSRRRLIENFKQFNIAESEQQSQLGKVDKTIAQAQENLIGTTDVLINKYKVELPSSIKTFRDAALSAKFAIDKVNETIVPTTAGDKAVLDDRKNFETPEQKAAREQREREAKAAKEKREREAAAERKKAIEDIKKLNEELKQLNEITPDTSPLDKEVIALNEKFAQLKELAHGSREELKKIDEQYYKELFKIQLKFSRQELEEFVKKEDEKVKRAMEFNARIAALTLDTSTNDRFDKAFKDQEEKNKKIKEQQDKFLEEKLQAQKDYLQSVVSIEQFFSDSKTQKENDELARDQQINDAKKRNLDRQLNSKLISQKQYDREIQKIDKDEEKRKHEIALRQFKRKQRQDVAEALLNGTLAVLMDLKTIPKVIPGTVIPNPELPAAIILDAITTAAKVGAALAVEPPKFAGGGKVGGRSHADGGNPILDGSGRKIAEIEKGEGIINKKSMADGKQYTVSGTPSQIASSINRLHGGVGWDSSAIVIPQWRTIKPQRMNFPVMKKAYATGGVFQTQQTTINQTTSDPIVSQSIDRLNSILDRLEANGIPAYTLLTQQEKQQVRLDNIRRDSTMK